MRTKDALNERRQALEDEFFHRVDEKLLTDMKAMTAAESNRKRLEAATGITNSDLLDELLAAGASAEAVSAISLVPLILVAWASGKVEPEEREQVLKAESDHGITSDTPAAQILEHWLERKRNRELGATRKHYIAAVVAQMVAESSAALRTDIIGRATAVATAAGGLLGFGRSQSTRNTLSLNLKRR